MIKAGSLIVDIGANVAKIKNDFEEVRGQAKNFSKTMKTILGGISLGYLAREVYRIGKAAADSIDQIHKMSQSAGISSEKFSMLSYAAGQSRVEIGKLVMANKTLAQATYEARQGSERFKTIFDALGITTSDNKGRFRDTASIMEDVAATFKRMEDGTLKTYYATKLFGRSGMDLIPMLNEGREGFAKWTKEAKDFNLIIGEETGRKVQAMMDAFDRLQSIGRGNARAVMSGMADSFRQIADSWVELGRGAANLETIGETLGRLAKAGNLAALTVVASFQWAQNAIIGILLTIPTQLNKAIDSINSSINSVHEKIKKEGGFFGAIVPNVSVPKIPFPKIETGDIKKQLDAIVDQYFEAIKALNAPLGDVGKQGDVQSFGVPDEKALDQAEKFKEKIEEMIQNLKFEKFALQQTAEAQAVYNALKKAGFDIDEATGQVKQKEYFLAAKEIEILAGEVRALENVKGALKSLETTQEKNAQLAKDLDYAYLSGWITLEQYNKVLEDLTKKEEKKNKITEKTIKNLVTMKNVFGDYLEEINNQSKQIGDSIVSAFRKAEDILVDFVTTGKMKLTDFFNFIKQEIARIAIRQAIIAPLAGYAFGALFGGAAGAGSGEIPTVVAHSGGIVGRGRMIPAGAYDHAPRYHQGLRSNERPAILEVGEQVIPKNQTGRGLTINVPVTVAERNPRLQSDLRSEIEDTVIRVLRKYS